MHETFDLDLHKEDKSRIICHVKRRRFPVSIAGWQMVPVHKMKRPRKDEAVAVSSGLLTGYLHVTVTTFKSRGHRREAVGSTEDAVMRVGYLSICHIVR